MIDKLSDRIRHLLGALSSGLIEREDHVKLMMLAALAGEHVLLIGPPGTAKSLLARRLRLAFRDATFFERLLTQFSVPEDLFGPYSLEDLDQGRYRRLTEGYLADADVGFLDEIFKSNPSILNALLTLLNERVFHNVPPADENGNSATNAPLPLPVPLKCLVGASNEVPEPGELDALYDRFLVRCEVGPVVDFRKLLQSGNEDEPAVDPKLALTSQELAEIRNAARSVVVPMQVDELLEMLRYRMAELQLNVSDRRWLKIRKLLQVAAYTCSRDQVTPLDLLLVPHCVWSPRQEEKPTDPSSKDEERVNTHDDPRPNDVPLDIRNALTARILTRIWSTGPSGNIRHREIDVEAWQEKLERCAVDALNKAQVSSLCRQARDCHIRIESLRQNLSNYAASNESDYVWFDGGVVRSALESLATAIDTCVRLCDRMTSNIESFEALIACQDVDSRVRRGGLAAPSSSSNRTCRFPAYGFRSDFCQRCNQRSCGRS
jgi:MoxR-like ATPase